MKSNRQDMTVLLVFQRYGYGGFVQLHHHCKVSQVFWFFFVSLRVQTGALAVVLHILLGTQQPLCGPVRLVLALRAAAELSVVPVHRHRFTLNTATAQKIKQHPGNFLWQMFDKDLL